VEDELIVYVGKVLDEILINAVKLWTVVTDINGESLAEDVVDG
jgi:hypothetical protein